MYLPNNQPKVITYRDYKNFDNSHFSEELLYEIKKLGPLNKNISIFHHTCIAVLEKYAPEKRKYIRANQANFMDSKLNHAIMLRSKLRNKFLKSRSNKDGEAYKKQRNLCVSLLRQNKKDYFETLDMKSVTDNKMSWKTVAPLFSNKSRASNNITLSENEKLITNDQKSAEVFNNYFNSIVEKLNIQIDQNLLNDASLFDDPIIAAIHKYKRHPSTLKIKEQLKKDDLFSFYHVNPDKMLKIIENIDSKKATQHGDIPVRIIKENKFIFSKVLSEIFNFYIDNNTFPNGLKKADIIPIYKKDDPFDKTNYRPISILPVLSKPFERCLYDQIYEYIDTILSNVQCGFRKGFSTQYSLIAMIEKWRKNMDKGKSCAALLTDLSKAFDCIVHDFLIAKLEAYGFSYEALKVIYNYLTDRKHRTKVSNSFSDFIDLLLGVPQGSILGPLLFNIYICDLFFFVEEDNVTSYADDTTPYSNSKNVVTVLENIETKGKEVFNWFSMNYLKANPGKSHLLLTSRDEASIKIDDTDIKSSSSKKLLGVIIDNKLTFNEHVSKLCKRASNELHALARISKYMTKDKLRTVMNAFFTS